MLAIVLHWALVEEGYPMARIVRLGRSVLGVIVAIMFAVVRLVVILVSPKGRIVWARSQGVAPGFPANCRIGIASALRAPTLPLIALDKLFKTAVGIAVQVKALKFAIQALQLILAIQPILLTPLLGHG